MNPIIPIITPPIIVAIPILINELPLADSCINAKPRISVESVVLI